MRKVLFTGLIILMLFLAGCKKKPKLDPEQNALYTVAVDYGYKGTYEQWLTSIKNDLGVPGDDIEFSVSDGYIKWKNTNEDQWYNLVALVDLIGEPGTDGSAGLDGREVLLKVEDGYIKWQYELDESWTNLIELSLLTGEQGIGILSAEISEIGELIINYSNGVSENLGSLLKAFRVQFKNIDGLLIDVQYVLPGRAAVAPDAPELEGHNFTGWSEEFHNIIEDTDIYAQYSLKQYIVIVYDETTGNVEFFDVEHGETLNLGVINKNYYEFIGWFTGQGPNDEQIYNTTPITRDLILYPRWITKAYPLKYQYATDDDFIGNEDGHFMYVGDADYVIIPEYIKGIKITYVGYDRALSMFTQRNDIKGVIFEGEYNITNMDYLFSENTSSKLELDFLTTTNVTSMKEMFYQAKATDLNLSSFDTSQVTNMKNMFLESKTKFIDFSSFDTSNVTDMSGMFYKSEVFFLNLSSFDTSKVTNMSGMFYQTSIMNLDLNSFDTSNVTNMSSMFGHIDILGLYLSAFDTTKVTDMSFMFQGAKINYLDSSSFNTSNVLGMAYMFDNSKIPTLNLTNFDTSKVTNMRAMFRDSTATLIDVTSFDTSNVTIMEEMFAGTKVQVLDLSSFDTTNVTNRIDMFLDSEAILGYGRNQLEVDKFNVQKNIFMLKT